MSQFFNSLKDVAMAKKTLIKGVPKVWILMMAQSYVEKQVLRRADGTPRWFHKVKKGYTADRRPVFEEEEDKEHGDPKSYQKDGMVVAFRPGRPAQAYADNAAGLIVTGQAIWCEDENTASGLTEAEIVDQFCPEAHRETMAALSESA